MLTQPTFDTFLNKPNEQDEKIVLFGAPLDFTTSKRTGTRFGPNAIRRESHFIDTYSIRQKMDWDDLPLGDIGNLECTSVERCLLNIETTIKQINGIPVMLGGEHTITLGALRALNPELVVIFDAHLDLRDKLFGERLCHATYLRRVIEELDCNALIVGARALSSEEIIFAESSERVTYISAQKCIREQKAVLNKIYREINSLNSIYLSIDMDVLDPSYAPAVGNPHPEGLTTTFLLDTLDIMGSRVVGMDLNEVYPHYDSGITATTAAYVLLESMYSFFRQ
jgi:agmatinase